MKLGRLANPEFHTALSKLIKSDQVPVRTALKIRKLSKSITEEYQRYEEVRLALLNKYGEKDKKGQLATDDKGNVKLKKDSEEKFMKEFQELNTTETKLPTLTVKELGDQIRLSATDLAYLEDLITE